jgi:murein tripeptide amidase MpaA
MMHGFLEHILGDTEAARYLRSRIVFKVVPMLNPDGVVLGNYRTGLAG